MAEVEQLSGGGGSYTGLLRALVALKRQQRISTTAWALRYPELSSVWLDLLQVELDGPEWIHVYCAEPRDQWCHHPGFRHLHGDRHG